jgi:hypothetical protein
VETTIAILGGILGLCGILIACLLPEWLRKKLGWKRINLRAAFRAAIMPDGRRTTAIAQRARCCRRPNVLPEGCPENVYWGTRANHEFWERLAALVVSKNPGNVDGWVVLGHSRFHLNDFGVYSTIYG